MAEDNDDSQQTEQPTQKRLEQAREAGDVVKSTEVSAFVVLAGATLAIAMFGKSLAVGIAGILTQFIQAPDQMAVDGAGLASLMRGGTPMVPSPGSSMIIAPTRANTRR